MIINTVRDLLPSFPDVTVRLTLPNGDFQIFNYTEFYFEYPLLLDLTVHHFHMFPYEDCSYCLTVFINEDSLPYNVSLSSMPKEV